MNASWVWLNREFPWLGPGFLHAVAERYAPELERSLTGLGFRVATMMPSTPEQFHDALAAALSFPSYYGRNWDAAHDCFRELHVPHPFALVWRNADGISASDPKLFGEACAVLAEEFTALGGRGIQAELVITGTGPAFRAPTAE